MTAARMFWWVRHDFATYKVPIPEGRVMLPHDFLAPGYMPDMTEQWYSFVHGRRDKRKVGDFSGLYDSAFFASERAITVLAPMFESHGRVYPVRCDYERYYFVLIDTVHEAVDLDKSEYERSGVDADVKNDISKFRKIVLRDDFTTEDDIFRLAGSFVLSTKLLVSDRFKNEYERHNLTGLLFRPTRGAH